jgi:short-subunit dehydrogenase involved in D-alanine esterification of teichoic acids
LAISAAAGARLTVSSGLAFVLMSATPTYSATKAAVHSYSMSLCHQLRETSVEQGRIGAMFQAINGAAR